MSVADELATLTTNLSEAYDALEAKGASMPEDKNTANLASTIETITGGGSPSRPPLPDYPYDVPEFDGGDYGAIAYLKDNEVNYYQLTSETDAVLNAPTYSTTSEYTIKALDDGFNITSFNILGFSIGSQVETISANFLTGCKIMQSIYFNSASSLTSIGSYFLSYCTTVNCPITIPETVTTVGQGFLYSCPSFNQPIEFLNPSTTIGSSFLFACTSFNQEVDLPENLVTVSQYFLSGCRSFNQNIQIPETVTLIDSYFMRNCTSFNKPLFFYENLITINNYFMENCTSFNQELNISGYTQVALGFLKGCTSFNQPLDMSKITQTSSDVLSGCTSFNQPLSLDSCTTIGGSFLSGCTSFNQPLSLDSCTTIGSSFLYNASSFNQPIDLSECTSIDSSFLSGCTSFNQDITIPETVTLIGGYFLYRTNSMTSKVTVECPASAISSTSINYTLGTDTSTAESYTEGIQLSGTYADAWKTKLPNRASNPFRNLYVVQ